MRHLLSIFLCVGAIASAQQIFPTGSGGGGGGGTGCIPAGSSGQILTDDGAGGCVAITTTGTGSGVKATSPTLVTPALGTPSAVVLTNGTGLPISSGVAGLGSGIATFLATPSSANLAAALTNETGSGAAVFATSPILVTPALGTPSAIVLTNATGLPAAAITGLLGLANGGTNADLSATGGASQVLKQTSSGAAVTVARLACADLSDAGAGCSGSGGTGTVTVVGAGNLTSTALVTGGGSQTLQTAAATATMDSSGNISSPGNIGTNATGGSLPSLPSNSLHYAVGSNGRITVGSIANPAFVTSARWDGTVGSLTAVQSGEQIGGYNSYAYDGATLIGPLGSFRCFANQNQSVGAGGTYCEVAETPNGSTTLTASMRWQATGGVTLPSTVTGGDQGAGTLNATNLYVTGTTVAKSTLANLGSVSINSVLGFQTGIAVGTTTNPASNLVFNASGTYGTGSYTFAGTPTANRTITLPDSSFTVATLGANTFTALQTYTIASANGGVIASTGYSLTGSNSTNMVDLAGTWNTTGTSVTALKLAITNTAVGASSLLMNLLAGSSGTTSEFSVSPAGVIVAAGNLQAAGLSALSGTGATSGNILLAQSGTIAFGASARSIIGSSANGLVTLSNAAGTGFTRLVFGTYDNSTPTSNAGLSVTVQANPIINVTDGNGGKTAVLLPSNFATVSVLPNCATAAFKGSIANVLDATAPALGVAVTGGGSAFAQLVCNGTNWTVTGI